MWVFWRTRVKSRAMTTEKTTAAPTGWVRPHSAPMAMPVKAEWPKASEKKAMRLSTTMVDSRPNRGVTTNTASRAFFIKSMVSGAAHSKGSQETSQYQKFTGRPLLPPLSSGERPTENLATAGPPPAGRRSKWSAARG